MREQNDNDLHGTFDCVTWAERFTERVQDGSTDPTDVGTMMAWFAGAIMTGHDHHLHQGI